MNAGNVCHSNCFVLCWWEGTQSFPKQAIWISLQMRCLFSARTPVQSIWREITGNISTIWTIQNMGEWDRGSGSNPTYTQDMGDRGRGRLLERTRPTCRWRCIYCCITFGVSQAADVRSNFLIKIDTVGLRHEHGHRELLNGIHTRLGRMRLMWLRWRWLWIGQNCTGLGERERRVLLADHSFYLHDTGKPNNRVPRQWRPWGHVVNFRHYIVRLSSSLFISTKGCSSRSS